MLDDVVVDTNVMLHAQNPNEGRFSDSQALLRCLLEIPISLCVDEGFDISQERNRSHIGAEYLEHLRFGSIGYTVISHLASNSRIKHLPRLAPRPVSRRINQLLRNRRDRVFLNVAYNSIDMILVSHDYIDFQQNKRDTIQDELEVSVVDASACLVFLHPA